MHKRIIVICAVLVSLAGTRASCQELPAVKNRPTVALALGGGGTRGAAHIGVLRVFEREHIPVDYIAGCSMGAVVGGLYAAGLTLDEIEGTLLDESLQKAYAPGSLRWRFLIGYTTKFRFMFMDRPYAGLFSGKKFVKFIDKMLPENAKLIENTKIPFCAVCTNLIDGQAYKLCKGELSQAILASSALPPVVRPVEIDDNLFVDGAVRSNVPTVSARQFNADIVIAVPVDEAIKPVDIKKFTSVRAVANRVTSIVLSVVDAHHIQLADYSVIPDVSNIAVLSKKHEDLIRAIAAGEEAATAALPKIKELIAKKAGEKTAQSSNAPNSID